MTAERWQTIKVILEEVLELEAEQRAAFLDASCQGDDELRREVESLLASEPELGDFIETPVFRIRPEEGTPPLPQGQRLGAYRIVREIGRGGMGSVYLAERADEEFERRVALKLIRRGMDSEEIVRRFRAERQILAHLDHENIAKLLDGGTTEDGRPYFVMEYVEGRPIDEECDARKLPIRRRLELFQQVCSAIHFAHQNLVVHRDLKPGNILVTPAGVPKLLDFGIAKLLSPDDDGAFTRADLRPMTPEYASPEQVRGGTITTASDVYALGVLLYTLLTGHPPYRPSIHDPQSLVRVICEENPPRPSSVIRRVEEVKQPDGSTARVTPESVGELRDGEARTLSRQLAGDLDNIVLKAMSKEPQRRYASVDQLADDIGRHLQGLPVFARKDTLGYRTAKLVGRHKVGAALASLLLVLMIGFSVTVTFLWQRAESEKTRAEAVAGFLEEVFTISDPSKARGETVTARALLDEGAEKIDRSLQTQPALQADLKETMGRVYRKLGLSEPARPLLEDALRLHRKTLGDDHPIVARNLHNLAGALRDLGENAAAETMIREALRIQRQHGDTQSIDYAKGLTNLGALLEDKGQLDEAEALYKESLAIKRSLPDVDEADITRSLNNLGKVRQARGDLATATNYYREALAIRRRLAAGRPDPELADSLNNMGSLLEDQGDLAGAEAFHRQALEMRRRLFGDRNIQIVSSLNNLAHVLQAEDKVAEAEALYREAVSIADEAPGSNPFRRGVMLRNLASVLVAQGKVSEGEARAREAIEIIRAAKPDSWRVADAESVLGSCLAAQRRFQEAEPLLLRSYRALEQDSRGGAPYAPEARQRIVALYTAWGKPERAAELQRAQ